MTFNNNTNNNLKKTLKLLMNQFHSSKKNSYSIYCRIRSDGSLIALGGKIPDISYIVAKLTTFCVGSQARRRSIAVKEMNTDEWHMHELRNSDLAGSEHISECNKE